MQKLIIYSVERRQSIADRHPIVSDSGRVQYVIESNPLSPYLGLHCALIDENLDTDAEYIGFENSTLAAFPNVTPSDDNHHLESLLEGHCYVFRMMMPRYGESYLDHLGIQKYRKQLSEYLYQINNPDAADLINESSLRICNFGFIMHREDFIRLRSFLNDVLTFMTERNGMETPDDIRKVCGRLTYSEDGSKFSTDVVLDFVMRAAVDAWLRTNLKVEVIKDEEDNTIDIIPDGEENETENNNQE